jgi:RES domain-containing protein
MRVYRLQKSKYATREAILSGEGAARTGGRWNKVGTPLVYTSATPELALLEVLVHLEGTPIEDLPPFSLVILEIPDDSINQVSFTDLPDNWRDFPAPLSLIDITQPWLRSSSHLTLKIPSAVMPLSFNFLLNPKHTAIEKVHISEIIPFVFDNRLAK